MTPTTLLMIRPNEVVHETVDGEVVIVDLSCGVYFSTDGVGTALWAQLDAGTTLQNLTEWTGATYPDEPTAPAEVNLFVRQLYEHKLIEQVDQGTPGDAPPGPSPYATPKLQAFNDMESLLLLDPIHDVEPDKGWPNVE